MLSHFALHVLLCCHEQTQIAQPFALQRRKKKREMFGSQKTRFSLYADLHAVSKGLPMALLMGEKFTATSHPACITVTSEAGGSV